MHLNERIALLDKLIDNAPAQTIERAYWKAERLGYDILTLGMSYRPDMFLDSRMQRRFELGYADAVASSQWGDGLTLSPIEVGMLKAVTR